jgi:hypothetical protein
VADLKSLKAIARKGVYNTNASPLPGFVGDRQIVSPNIRRRMVTDIEPDEEIAKAWNIPSIIGREIFVENENSLGHKMRELLVELNENFAENVVYFDRFEKTGESPGRTEALAKVNKALSKLNQEYSEGTISFEDYRYGEEMYQKFLSPNPVAESFNIIALRKYLLLNFIVSTNLVSEYNTPMFLQINGNVVEINNRKAVAWVNPEGRIKNGFKASIKLKLHTALWSNIMNPSGIEYL